MELWNKLNLKCIMSIPCQFPYYSMQINSYKSIKDF